MKNASRVRTAVAAAVMAVSLLAAAQVFAAENDVRMPGPGNGGRGERPQQLSGVSGTVTAVNGTTITVTTKDNVVYTVDASGAIFRQTPAAPSATGSRPASNTIAITDIKAGDTIMARGELKDLNLAAKEVIKGELPLFNAGERPGQERRPGGENDRGPAIGAMRPRIIGSITAVNGTALTVTGADSAAYIVDAAKAKVFGAARGNGDKAVADLKTGDKVAVEGEFTVSPIVASAIILEPDAAALPANSFQAIGKVTAINGASLTLQIGSTKKEGDKEAQPVTLTVNTTASTVIRKNGQAAVIGDLKDNENVSISGKLDVGTATVAAAELTLKANPAQMRRGEGQQNGDKGEKAKGPGKNGAPGLLSKIGNFFKNFFGKFGKGKK